MKRSILISVVVAFSMVGYTQARNDWIEKPKLLAADGEAGDTFGYSVSISGLYAIVTASSDDGGKGAAYIFRWDGVGWSEQQKLTASDGAAWDGFGCSVSISGDYAIVGAHFDDDRGTNSGSAYIFKRNGTTWLEQKKLVPVDGAADDRFGHSVSINGDYAIIAAYYDGDRGTWAGSAYIYKRDGTSWIQQQKLLASDGAPYDYFGYSVSMGVDYAIIGAYGDDDKGSIAGSAYIFKWNGTSWVEQQKLFASDAAIDDSFGWSVSISGDYAFIGAKGDDDKGTDSGSAYVFNRNGTSWTEQQKLRAPDGEAGDSYGFCVSINGDDAVLGAHSDDDRATDAGSAYIYKLNGTAWTLQQKLTASDGAAGDRFGLSFSISGDYTIVGSYADDDNGADSGSAYIFARCPSGDLSGDCLVNFVDIAILCGQWLQFR